MPIGRGGALGSKISKRDMRPSCLVGFVAFVASVGSVASVGPAARVALVGLVLQIFFHCAHLVEEAPEIAELAHHRQERLERGGVGSRRGGKTGRQPSERALLALLDRGGKPPDGGRVAARACFGE